MSRTEDRHLPHPPRNPSVWTWPIVLAISMTVGLASALLGDGIWDALSWVALGGPLVVGAVAMKRNRR